VISGGVGTQRHPILRQLVFPREQIATCLNKYFRGDELFIYLFIIYLDVQGRKLVPLNSDIDFLK
jgi:hypothetical protein